MKIFLFIVCLLSSSLLLAKEGETHLGIDMGYGFLDIGADQTAQNIANLSGSTVTYTADEATWVGRGYIDYSIDDNFFGEIGYFISGELNAKYTLSGTTVTEAYSANGLDFAAGFKDSASGLFFKVGGHSSEVDGKASITISGTTYAANAAASGTGLLFGGGIDFKDNSRIGYTYYSNLGGLTDADVGLIYIGYRF
jgi:hypothetical protein